MLYDRKTGTRKSLTEGFDRWIGTFTWDPDSTRVFFVAENLGQAPIYSISLKDSWPRLMVEGYNDDLKATWEGSLVFTKMSLYSPNQIYKTAFHSKRDCPIDHKVDPSYEMVGCGAFREEELTLDSV